MERIATIAICTIVGSVMASIGWMVLQLIWLKLSGQ